MPLSVWHVFDVTAVNLFANNTQGITCNLPNAYSLTPISVSQRLMNLRSTALKLQIEHYEGSYLKNNQNSRDILLQHQNSIHRWIICGWDLEQWANTSWVVQLRLRWNCDDSRDLLTVAITSRLCGVVRSLKEYCSPNFGNVYHWFEHAALQSPAALTALRVCHLYYHHQRCFEIRFFRLPNLYT